MKQCYFYIKNMVRPKSFDLVLKDIRERKKFEKKREEENSKAKCDRCSHSLQAIGRSNIPGLCSICAHLVLIPEPEQ